MPTKQERQGAIDRLRSSVEIWINGTAETPFVYDVAWGGVVSCGCNFDGTHCTNRYPDCPGFLDQGLNFGNGTLFLAKQPPLLKFFDSLLCASCAIFFRIL